MSELTASTDLTPLPARAAGGNPLSGMRGVTQNLRGLLDQPAVIKSLPAIGFIALIGLAALIWMVVSAPPSRTLFSGLTDQEKGAVVEALNTGGIAYEIDRSTGAIAVSEADYHQARMMLAGQGLPRSGPSGDEMIGNLPLGASRAVETERIRSARELDLARTIEGIDVVQSARVHLAVQSPSVFVREQPQAAASVMLTLASGRTLGDAQVQAIVHLVASSVPGLAPEGVSIVDQNGRLLSRRGDANSLGDQQLEVQSAVEERYRQAISTLLTPVLGAGNFTAEVNAEMDFSETQSTRENFPENQRVVSAEQGQVSTGPDGAGAAVGIPGALSNQAPPPAEASATPEAAQPEGEAATTEAAAAGPRTENYNRTFALGREVSVTRQQPGTIKRLSVAVALRNPEGARPRSRQELQALEQLVKGAVGFSQSRGDVVALSAREFAPTETIEPAWYEASWIWPLARNVTALAVAALLIFGLGRPLLRKGSAMVAKRAEASRTARSKVGGEIASVLADRARSDLDMKVTLEMIEATRDYETRAALIRNFVRQDPARAAVVVRDLIRADARAGV